MMKFNSIQHLFQLTHCFISSNYNRHPLSDFCDPAANDLSRNQYFCTRNAVSNV